MTDPETLRRRPGRRWNDALSLRSSRLIRACRDDICLNEARKRSAGIVLAALATAFATIPGAHAEGLDIVDLETQPWYEASDRAVAREIASPRNSGAENMSIADIRIPAGVSVKPHYHDWEEVYYVTAGNGVMHVDGSTEEIHAGQAVVIPPNAWHHVTNPTDVDLRLIVVCAPPWHPEGLKYE